MLSPCMFILVQLNYMMAAQLSCSVLASPLFHPVSCIFFVYTFCCSLLWDLSSLLDVYKSLHLSIFLCKCTHCYYLSVILC